MAGVISDVLVCYLMWCYLVLHNFWPLWLRGVGFGVGLWWCGGIVVCVAFRFSGFGCRCRLVARCMVF